MSIKEENDAATLTAIEAVDAARTQGAWSISTAIHEDRPGTNEVCDLVNDTWIITTSDLAPYKADAAFIEMASTGVPALCRMAREQSSHVAYYRRREESIIAACERVADGGQYRADIVSAIERIRRERDEARREVQQLRGLLVGGAES